MKGILIEFLFLIFGNEHRTNRQITRIIGAVTKNIGFLILGRSHQREDINRPGNRKKLQSTTHTIIVIFIGTTKIINILVINHINRLKKRSDTLYTLNGIDKKSIKSTYIAVQQPNPQSTIISTGQSTST